MYLVAIIATLATDHGAALAQTTGAVLNGLQGEYVGGTVVVKRTDGVVDFDWGTQPPVPGIRADNFGVKWTGQIQAPVTGTYWFAAQADDGLRVWVDGKLQIDAKTGSYPGWFVGNGVSLTAGRKYDIRMEYTEMTGNAAVRFLWQYPGRGYHTVPRDRLFSVRIPNESAVPSAPVNLVATGEWRENCCNNMPMAHVELSWSHPLNSPVAIQKFNIYRGGVLIKSGVTGTHWEDMGVSSGQTYSYQVVGVSADGRGSAKSAVATATAPFPPYAWTAPTNLYIQGVWAATYGKPSDILTWDATPGAVRYNVYQYDRLIGFSTGTTFTVPVADYYKAMTYAVTAVNAGGEETLPGNIASAQGLQNPSFRPTWMPNPPATPVTLQATTEWNAGKPRVRLTWLGSRNAYTFDIYRDGAKVARGIWGQAWFDNTVRAGGQHSYSVSAVNVPWDSPVESAPTSSVAVLVPANPPAVSAGARVTIKQVVPNDDSVMVHFDAVPGATDYRGYETGKPGSYKYSGGSLSIEMNGLTPGVPATLIVEAVDKLGPFQKMDGMLGPGAINHDGHVNMAINGLGDPSNIPVVLAASTPFVVSSQSRVLKGTQVFFDTFRDSQPFVPAPVPAPLLAANPREAAAVENNRWVIYNVRGDLLNSRAFVMGNHFMDTLYDGGTPYTGAPLHLSKASLVMKPKSVADISGDKVLHVTFEVDAHFSGRRWCDVMIADANDTITNPGAFLGSNQLPSVMGNVFRWEIKQTVHSGQLVRGKNSSGTLNVLHLFDQAHGVGPDNYGPPSRRAVNWSDIPAFNGTIRDLDKRHRFDLYLSRNRFRMMEQGKVVKDAVFPDGVKLPFDRAAVYFVHQVYHSSLERSEAQTSLSADAYWINYRPYADERHWDNMGFEVLNSFPTD